METKKPKIGKKGGTKRVAEKFSQMRKQPLSKEFFEIIDENYKKNQPLPEKKSAKSKGDLEL